MGGVEQWPSISHFWPRRSPRYLPFHAAARAALRRNGALERLEEVLIGTGRAPVRQTAALILSQFLADAPAPAPSASLLLPPTAVAAAPAGPPASVRGSSGPQTLTASTTTAAPAGVTLLYRPGPSVQEALLNHYADRLASTLPTSSAASARTPVPPSAAALAALGAGDVNAAAEALSGDGDCGVWSEEVQLAAQLHAAHALAQLLAVADASTLARTTAHATLIPRLLALAAAPMRPFYAAFADAQQPRTVRAAVPPSTVSNAAKAAVTPAAESASPPAKDPLLVPTERAVSAISTLATLLRTLQTPGSGTAEGAAAGALVSVEDLGPATLAVAPVDDTATSPPAPAPAAPAAVATVSTGGRAAGAVSPTLEALWARWGPAVAFTLLALVLPPAPVLSGPDSAASSPTCAHADLVASLTAFECDGPAARLSGPPRNSSHTEATPDAASGATDAGALPRPATPTPAATSTAPASCCGVCAVCWAQWWGHPSGGGSVAAAAMGALALLCAGCAPAAAHVAAKGGHRILGQTPHVPPLPLSPRCFLMPLSRLSCALRARWPGHDVHRGVSHWTLELMASLRPSPRCRITHSSPHNPSLSLVPPPYPAPSLFLLLVPSCASPRAALLVALSGNTAAGAASARMGDYAGLSARDTAMAAAALLALLLARASPPAALLASAACHGRQGRGEERGGDDEVRLKPAADRDI